MAKSKFKKAISFQNKDGKDVYELHMLLHLIGKKYNEDFYDTKGSFSDFDIWCDQKGYGKKDPAGKIRSHSNIWFAEREEEIKKGLWNKSVYCCCIDVFVDELPEVMNPQNEGTYVVETLKTSYLLENAKQMDIKQFGNEDDRVKLINIFIKEMGDSVEITNKL